jgi:hypothetical protein
MKASSVLSMVGGAQKNIHGNDTKQYTMTIK